MKPFAMLIVAAITFGLCFLLDKGFLSLFRNQAQHRSGTSVRYHKRYAVFGILLSAVGLMAFVLGLEGDMFFLIGGILVLLVGAFLILLYMCFGIFYDQDSFLVLSFGKKQTLYFYRDITSQQLFNASGNIVIELYLKDGRSVSLQTAMDGVYPFLDTAFAGWCRQTNTDPADCPFHEPDKHCWFPQA